MTDLVKYRIVAPVFLNGARLAPNADGSPTFVKALAGLAGKALIPVEDQPADPVEDQPADPVEDQPARRRRAPAD